MGEHQKYRFASAPTSSELVMSVGTAMTPPVLDTSAANSSATACSL